MIEEDIFDLEAIVKILAGKFPEIERVYLFGSRTDDSMKGGDIDIYIQTSQKDNILKSKIIFLREFEKKFGEQKVDLLIDNNKKKTEIFEIAKKGIKL